MVWQPREASGSPERASKTLSSGAVVFKTHYQVVDEKIRESRLALFTSGQIYCHKEDYSIVLLSVPDFKRGRTEITSSFDCRFGSSSSQTSQTSGDFCRICHESDSISPLLSPCLCSGSLRYVHEFCLIQWLTASETNSCELCKFPFIMQSKIKPFNEVSARVKNFDPISFKYARSIGEDVQSRWAVSDVKVA